MSLLRTIVFGAIVGAVGKKLYDNGSLDRFGQDLKTRAGEAREKFDELRSARAAETDAPGGA